LGREEELLLPLHRVGSLIRHMERIGGEVAIGGLQRGIEGLVVVAQLLHDTGTFLHQALLQMGQLFLVHYSSMVEADSVRPCWYRCTPTTTPCPSISNSCSRSGAGARAPTSIH